MFDGRYYVMPAVNRQPGYRGGTCKEGARIKKKSGKFEMCHFFQKINFGKKNLKNEKYIDSEQSVSFLEPHGAQGSFLVAAGNF